MAMILTLLDEIAEWFRLPGKVDDILTRVIQLEATMAIQFDQVMTTTQNLRGSLDNLNGHLGALDQAVEALKAQHPTVDFGPLQDALNGAQGSLSQADQHIQAITSGISGGGPAAQPGQAPVPGAQAGAQPAAPGGPANAPRTEPPSR